MPNHAYITGDRIKLRGNPAVLAENRIWIVLDEGDLGVAAVMYTDNAYPNDHAYFATYRARGTEAAPRRIKDGNCLGEYDWSGYGAASDTELGDWFGSYLEIEGFAVGDWTATSHGSRMELISTRPGTTNRRAQVQIYEPDDDAVKTGFWMRIGSTMYRVEPGAADSAGTGFRVLRIAN